MARTETDGRQDGQQTGSAVAQGVSPPDAAGGRLEGAKRQPGPKRPPVATGGDTPGATAQPHLPPPRATPDPGPPIAGTLEQLCEEQARLTAELDRLRPLVAMLLAVEVARGTISPAEVLQHAQDQALTREVLAVARELRDRPRRRRSPVPLVRTGPGGEFTIDYPATSPCTPPPRPGADPHGRPPRMAAADEAPA